MFSAPTLLTVNPLLLSRKILLTCNSSSAQAFKETAVDSARKPASLYDVLRVERTASPTEIKTAYRSMAKMYHPDAIYPSESDGLDFIEIHNAYATLSDPAARALYDMSLGARQRRASFGYSDVSRVGFHRTRRWETDQCW